ncbi:response regulator transcription factor [Exiguobacterium artemiae]|uniref:response regulator transcription factor n=1 Tax=Exiguobacterium artemiae TaxID=340145 RepID=UPI002963E6D2|nr:response regulator transcription factor [Exiguobacterium sibiricum]MDW2887008.1 response regulator transcription factor [Exiguobacterium sibiricum]
MARILIVDDEQRMLQLMKLYLAPYGHTCHLVDSAEKALEIVKTVPIDIALLDVMMPEMDGWTLCENIRRIADFPIIMVTARNQMEDVVRGRTVGADDYVAKPIHEGELLGRIELLIGREKREQYIFHGLHYDAAGYDCSFNEQKILLTKTEFQLLGKLLGSVNGILSREQLVRSLWGDDQSIEPRTIDSHMRHLREKLRRSGFPIDQYLETVRGVGYRWLEQSKDS